MMDTVALFPFSGVAIGTLLYLWVDLYPLTKSFRAFGREPSSWLLWLILTILNFVSYFIVESAFGGKFREKLGSPAGDMLVLIICTSGTVSILQSFTLKAADIKVVDIGPIVEKFRAAVLADITQRIADQKRRDDLQVAGRLAASYRLRIPQLRAKYLHVFTFGGRTPEQIEADLKGLESKATSLNIAMEELMALDIVKADPYLARRLSSTKSTHLGGG